MQKKPRTLAALKGHNINLEGDEMINVAGEKKKLSSDRKILDDFTSLGLKQLFELNYCI